MLETNKSNNDDALLLFLFEKQRPCRRVCGVEKFKIRGSCVQFAFAMDDFGWVVDYDE